MTIKKKVTKKKVRLGRGLEALLGDPQGRAGDFDASSEQLKQLPIEQLQRGKYQPRMNMDQVALNELAESIKQQGVVQPLLVRKLESGCYEIITGERRWRGAQLAGLTRVPVVVKQISDQNAMAVALIENIQREDLNSIEEAMGFQRLSEEFGLTHQEIADVVGRARASVTNILRLLSLHPRVRKLIEEGKIEMGHARALLGLPHEKQYPVAKKLLAIGMTVRKTEQLIADLRKGDYKKPVGVKNQDIQQLEDSLSKKIGAQVAIRGDKKGKLIIYYYSLDELDGILARIQ